VRQNKNARQSILFAMRFLRRTAKGEKKLPPLSAHGSALGANGGDGSWEKNSLPCAIKKRTTNSRVCRAPRKNARQRIFYRAFFLCRASLIKRAAKYLFTVRPMKNARQRFSRTTKVSFSVVVIDL
jgi:hypothetical protein